MDGINKIGEFRGVPVYHDEYMTETDFRFGRGPKFPDAYYSGPAIYVNGILVKPDGTPIVADPELIGYETKFILTGATMEYIELHAHELGLQMQEKYDKE